MNQTLTEHAPAPKAARRNILARLYYGELSLPVTFWVFGVLLTILEQCCVAYLIYKLESLDRPTDYEDLLLPGLILLVLASLAWTYVVLVGQWRAAKKYQGRKIWAFLVKMSVALASAQIVWGFMDIKLLILFLGMLNLWLKS